MFSKITAVLAVAGLVSAAPLESRQDDLQQWQLSGISSFSPSGRPGSYPWITITANLFDPNTLNLGTSPADGSTVTIPPNNATNCQAKYISSSKPFDHIWPCGMLFSPLTQSKLRCNPLIYQPDNSGNGYWTMEILETSDFSIHEFDVKFTHVADTLYLGSQYKKTYTGTAHFSLTDNLSGSCGGSGVCSWGLKSGLSPYAIQQSEVA
jgi:hypothetical protein